MSYAVMYTVEIDGTIIEYSRVGTPWTLVLAVWGPLCDRYLGGEQVWREGEVQRLWDLAEDERVPRHQRAVLLTTFDYAIVEAERYACAAEDFRQFVEDFALLTSSLPTVARLLDDLALNEPHTMGVCFYHTSAAENLWHPGSEDGEPAQYEIYQNDKHFWVYETLEGKDAEVPATGD